MYYAAREGKNNLIDFLINHGCSVNQLDVYNQTPVFYACREGHIETIKKLEEKKAALDHVDNNG